MLLITIFIKKAFSIFLIALIGYYSFGEPLFYWAGIQICKIKAEFAARAGETTRTKLIVFSSGNKAFTLVDDDEILAGGKMYDIVKTCVSKGKVLYYAYADEDEDEFVQNLANSEKNNSSEKSLPGKNINPYAAKYFAVNKNLSPVCFSISLLTRTAVLKNDLSYNSVFGDIYAPPPEHLAS